MLRQPVKSKRKSYLHRLHQYYTYTGFYAFLGKNLKSGIWSLVLLVVIVVLLELFVLDFDALLYQISNSLSTAAVLILFFLSETFVGLLPPELFMAWVKSNPVPLFYLGVLSLLSYLAGCLAYFIGRMIFTIPRVKDNLEEKMGTHMQRIRKWGGFLIVAGALLPISYSLVSVASGIINYPLKYYLLFALFRFLRFFLIGTAVFSLL